MKNTIHNYIETKILPEYDDITGRNLRSHIEVVTSRLLEIAPRYNLVEDMCVTIAAYHDLGLLEGEDQHEFRSAWRLKGDRLLSTWFCFEQIELMWRAVEDHRSSSSNKPRSIYGKALAEANRDLSPRKVFADCVKFCSPALINEQIESDSYFSLIYNELMERYGKTGSICLWLPTERNENDLAKLRKVLSNKDKTEKLFKEIINV